MSSKEGGQVDDQGAYLLNPKIMSEVAEHEKAELKKQAECVPPWIPFDLFTPRLGDSSESSRAEFSSHLLDSSHPPPREG